jgi:RNA polymerase sigma-70 factor (TIGR02943 family)
MKNKLFTSSAKASDPANWVASYADYLYAYALNRLDDEDLCRDLVQETFLAALERRSEFRGESSEKTWMTAILRYKVIEVYRKRNASWLTTERDHHPEPEYFEPGNGHWKLAWAPQPMSIDTGDVALHKELAMILRKCLDRLPALWLTIFSMKHMDGEATEVICQQMKISTANYWVIIHRAKVNLRACLQKEGL